MSTPPKVKDSLMSMDFIQKITLSPFEKYVRFNRFPWKFILHLLLLALCTYQSLRIVSIEDKHTRIQEQVFSSIYLQNDDGSSSYPYYSLSDFTDSFFSVVNSTLALNETLLQYSDVSSTKYRLDIYYSEVARENIPLTVIEGNSESFLNELQKVGISPSDYPAMKEFLQKVESLQLGLSNILTYISLGAEGQLDSCLNWTISTTYSFQSSASIEAALNAQPIPCVLQLHEDQARKSESLFTIHLAILICAAFSLILSWRQVYFVSREYMHYKRVLAGDRSELGRTESRFKSHSNWEKNWEELGFFDKLKFFDFWFIVIVAGNFFQVFGAVVSLLEELITADIAIFEHKQVFVGFGVMLAWITILKYLQYSNDLNLMTATLAKSWSNLFVFLLGVMPFFLGFVFLGQTIFWKYNKFEDTSSSVITLFSLLNGDIVNDTFLETWAEGLVGQIYLILFMVLFYTAVQNVFVTIIMEGYEESIKQRELRKAIEQKQEKEREHFENHLQAAEDNQITPQQVRLGEQSADQLGVGSPINMSPEMSPEQQAGLKILRRNSRKVDIILEQMSNLFNEIITSELSSNEKNYLTRILKENLDSIGRSIKIQIGEIKNQ